MVSLSTEIRLSSTGPSSGGTATCCWPLPLLGVRFGRLGRHLGFSLVRTQVLADFGAQVVSEPQTVWPGVFKDVFGRVARLFSVDESFRFSAILSGNEISYDLGMHRERLTFLRNGNL